MTLKRVQPTPRSLNFQVEASSQNIRFAGALLCMYKIWQSAEVTCLKTSIALCTYVQTLYVHIYVQISEVYLLLNQIFPALIALNLKT